MRLSNVGLDGVNLSSMWGLVPWMTSGPAMQALRFRMLYIFLQRLEHAALSMAAYLVCYGLQHLCLHEAAWYPPASAIITPAGVELVPCFTCLICL